MDEPEALLERYKEDLKRDADTMQDQREKANEDMRFVNVSGGMWEGFLEDEYGDRTRLELDLVSDYINRFLGEWNQNRVNVEFKPDDEATNDDDADLINGVYRADFRQNSGKLSVDNAVDEIATCGYGAVKLGTVFVDEDDPENDNQRVEFRPIHNAYNTVFWDNAAQRIDKRDARHCTVLAEFTKESFQEAYPEKSPVSAYDPQNLVYHSWRADNKNLLYVASRYEIEKIKRKFFVYNDLAEGKTESYSEQDHEKIADELKANDLKQFVRERVITQRIVKKTVFSGKEILEEAREIAGRHIPIIPFYGYRAYVDGQEWYRGLVRKLMDPMRLFNMQISQLAENSASNGQEVPIFAPQQVEGLETTWADLNNKPYLLSHPLTDDAGNIIAQGPIGYLKPAQLDGSTTELIRIVPDFIQGMTGGAPQETLDPKTSGKAINALVKRENLNTQVINDNIECSIEALGEVYQSIAAEVYKTARSVRHIAEDGTESNKQLNESVLDEKTGKIITANKLDGKRFRAYSSAGPQYDTQREQATEMMKGMLDVVANHPATEKYVPAIVATMIENSVGVGLGPVKELARQEMLVQGLAQPETDEEKALVAAANQPQEDENKQLLEAAAEQAIAEAENLKASAIDKAASAEKKIAETQKIRVETDELQAESERSDMRTLLDVRRETFNRLPV